MAESAAVTRIDEPAAEPTPRTPKVDSDGAAILRQLIATRGSEPPALAQALVETGRQNDPTIWSAIQRQFGNSYATKVRTAINHVAEPGPPVADTDGKLLTPRDENYFGVHVHVAAGAHIAALEECRKLISDECGHDMKIQQRLQDAHVTIVVIPASVPMTDVDAFKGLKGKKTFDGRAWEGVRGSGGMDTPDGNFSIAVAEENLTPIKGVISGYPQGYSIGGHELAHGVELRGLTTAQRDRIKELYAARAKSDPGNKLGTWTDTYASDNELEYFAQATDTYFGRNAMGTNHNGKAWLATSDPDMCAFLETIYG